MVEIREARASDLPALAEVHVLGWQHGYRGLLPQQVLDDLRPELRMAQWGRIFDRTEWPGTGVLVAEQRGVLAGFSVIRPSEDDDLDPALVGEIASFYVRPAAWKQGIGRALMTQSLSRLTEAGRAESALWVLDGNERAIGFYRATGWLPDGAVRADEIGGLAIQDLRFRRSLR